MHRLAPLLIALSFVEPVHAQTIPAAEYAARRASIMTRLPDGIILLHARSAAKAMEQWGFVQDASFSYMTGLDNLPEAVLALDATRKRAILFVPPPPESFGAVVQGIIPETGAASAKKYGLDNIVPWDSLPGWLEDRIGAGVKTLYLDESRHPEALGAPDGMWPTSGEMTLWWRTLAREFPDVHMTSAREMLRSMRWKKSPAEVAALRANAKATVVAMREGVSHVRPGIRQRDAEAAVVAACIAAGAQGPSFWPWMMSGPTAHFQPLVRAFYDYSQLDRVVRAGETMRVDIGCAGHGYGADVGRTIPVSGKFTDGQRETWDLLASAYEAGMAAMKAGVTIDDVMRASRDEISKLAPSLTTPQGKRAAQSLLAERGMAMWSIHGVGIESGETPPSRLLVDGAVIAFEPMFSAGDDAFYLEDMILITATGHEVLSDGLPYSSAEIERMVGSAKTPASP